MKDLENEVKIAYEKAGIEPMTGSEIEGAVSEACKKIESGKAALASNDEAESAMNEAKAAIRKRPLPVGLNKSQHEYLDSKGNKAEYMRNLLVVDMAKAKS